MTITSLLLSNTGNDERPKSRLVYCDDLFDGPIFTVGAELSGSNKKLPGINWGPLAKDVWLATSFSDSETSFCSFQACKTTKVRVEYTRDEMLEIGHACLRKVIDEFKALKKELLTATA